jgi:NAD(P)-dependent dehydrogenase (short-subunit alcohol dehydrogenase family)
LSVPDAEPHGGPDRTVVVTGSASGIGAATCEYLAARGNRVIGVDLQDADIDTDLGTAEGRALMVDRVRDLAPGGIDGIVANAGVFREDSLSIRVNYFGAVATLEGLRPLLRGPAPRAVLVSSRAVLQSVDEAIVAACLAGDEQRAVELSDAKPEGDRGALYATSKRALARWLRRSAATAAWAGEGIPLNGVGPGSVMTPMTAQPRTPEEQERLMRERPMPLGGRAVAEDIAPVIAFFLSPENTKVTGQLLFVDGGGEVLMCREDIWAVSRA